MENYLINPHGGELINRICEKRDETYSCSSIFLSNIEMSDLYMIAIGALSPLKGFMGKEDYESVIEKMSLKNGEIWTIPITLSAQKKNVEGLKEGMKVFLRPLSEPAKIVGEITISEIFKRDKRREAIQIFKTEDEKHPGVEMLYRHGNYLIGGEVFLYEIFPKIVNEKYYLTPRECREKFFTLGWKRIVGFQTRNPIHRAHEYIIKCALEMADGLFIHPIVGETKSDDVPVEVRFECYESLIRNYFPSERVMLVANPSAMRYAGPKEAIHHAIIRKNYGCTHFIVGRDHAGVGNYYGPHDAQKIFDQFPQEKLGITPIFFENSFYCRKCEGMATDKTCSHEKEWHLLLSGTRVRELLSMGSIPPEEYARPEISSILSRHYFK